MRASLFVMMMLMRAPAIKIWRLHNHLKKHGIILPDEALLAHQLAGGDIALLTESLILAERQHLGVSFDRLCAIDLSTRLPVNGDNVLNVVQRAIEPQFYRVPKDGFHEFCVPARPTWRVAFILRYTTNLDRFVGGATIEKLASDVIDFVYRFYRERDGRVSSGLRGELQEAIMSASLDGRSGYNLTGCDVETR